MAGDKPQQDCYELHGESLAAARRLERLVALAAQRVQPLDSGNLADIQQSWQQFYQDVFDVLSKHAPDLLQATGLTTPSTVVKTAAGEYPRAYHEYPAIFASPGDPPRYFMYVPRDHFNTAFVPHDARKLSLDEESKVNSLLFAGGWLGNAPLFSLPRRGIATPANVKIDDVISSFAKAAGQYTPAEVNFIAAGRALEIVKNYEEALRDYNEKMRAAFDAVKAASEKLYPEMLRDLPAGEGLYTNLSGASQLIDGVDTGLTLSIRRDGKGGDFMQGGQVVPIPDNPYFIAHPYRGGDVAIKTRSDTPQGRALARILKAVPAQRPALSADADLQVNGISPNVVTIGQYKILRYFVADASTVMLPPCDAVPFPPAAQAWLRADEEDRRMGNVPPPMPQDVLRYLVNPQTVQVPRDSKPGRTGGPINPAK